MKLERWTGLLHKPASLLSRQLLRNPVTLLRTPVYRDGGTYDYTRMQYRPPADLEETGRLLHAWGEMGMHPGSLNWGEIIGYGGAVYSALKDVDHPCIDLMEVRENPADAPIVYKPPIEWGGVLIRTTGAVAILTQSYFGVPLDLREAFLYLSLNASRNIFSDLIPKHGIKLKRWIYNFGHIKWRKLTDAMMVTALAYPILSSVKKFLHAKFGLHLEYEMVAVPLSLFAVDAAIQFVTRKIRGFAKSVAVLDGLRPLVGNSLASLTFLALGLDYGQHYLYLLICKLFNEAWSGSVEGGFQHRAKKAARGRNFAGIFSLDKYKVPDPAAMAAINLVYILNVKSLASKVFRKIIGTGRVGDIEVGPVMRQITEALFDDQRIWAAAEFIFPGENQKVYRDELIAAFRINREAFRQNYSLAYKPAADPFEQQGIRVAGLHYVPTVLREQLAAAAARAGVKYLVVESPLLSVASAGR